MSALEQFQGELDGVRAVAADLGKALVVADLAVLAGFAGAPDFRRRVGALLGEGGTETGCACHAQNPPPTQGSLNLRAPRYVEVAAHRRRYPRASNPPVGVTLRALGRGALTIARTTARSVLRAVRRSPMLTIGVIGTFAAWDFLVPDEAVEVAKVQAEKDLYSEQLNRLPPQEALRLMDQLGNLYDGSKGGTSTLTWVLVGVGTIVAVPLVRSLLRRS